MEYFHNANSDMVRFYAAKNELYPKPLSDLVIVEPSYGFLLLRYIDNDVVISGSLNNKYFSKEMTEDISKFLEDSFAQIKNVYQPYHIDFFSVSDCDEYNGEY